MRFLIAALLLAAGSAQGAPAPARPLDPIVQAGDLWEAAPAGLKPDLGFRWTSAAREAIQTMAPGLSLFGVPVTAAVLRFQAGKPKEIDILFYDRGDNGDLSRDDFDALLKKCEDAVSAFSKTTPAPRSKDAASAVKAEMENWTTPGAKFLLEYSSIKEVKSRDIPFRAEFIRLAITPVEKPRGLLEEALASDNKGGFSGPSHVKKEPSGDVLIEGVPMVDQGRKGYCVVASAERVLRYYGQKVDQNELAEIADSSAQRGTSFSAMFDALKKLTARLRIKTRVEIPFDFETLQALATEYNRAAKKGRRANEIDIHGPDSDAASLYREMNFDILREARAKKPSELERFRKLVENRVDEGIPLLWSCMVGLAPETPPIHGFGGHMRLIIGYNENAKEILYSDSWGPGHELKRMPAADAWAITTGVSTIAPL